jgi:ABC-type spermidine/putrescine transport system permease subunit II
MVKYLNNIKGGLFAGATFAFIQSFTDYSMSLFLTSPTDRPITITIVITIMSVGPLLQTIKT